MVIEKAWKNDMEVAYNHSKTLPIVLCDGLNKVRIRKVVEYIAVAIMT